MTAIAALTERVKLVPSVVAASHGYAFPPARERLEQLEETIEILRRMWTEHLPSFQGHYFQIDQAIFERLATRLGFDDLGAAQRSPVALIGTPSQVVDELQERVETDGVSYFIVVATSEETQNLIVEHVLGAFA